MKNKGVLKISVIIPVLNEAGCIEECLAGLQELRQAGHEVIVVDGGSTDASVALATPLCDRLIKGAKGRARQMNTGAAVATGGILIFLHADTRFTFNPAEVLRDFNRDGKWGCFSIRLSGVHPAFRLFEFFINLRSRLTGIVSGDQTLFVCRGLFEDLGGFPVIPLMEDIAISKILKQSRSPVCHRETVISSSRRWERHGIIKTMLQMWLRRIRFALGVNPAVLAKSYD